MKKAIAGKVIKGSGSGGSGSGGNRRNPTNPNDPFGDPNNWIDPGPDNTLSRTPRNRNPNQPQNNQQLILIVLAIGIVIFFLMQKEASPSRSPEYYDY